MWFGTEKSFRFLTIALLMLAMGATGFAHRFASPSTTAEIADFLAAGGNLSDLCGGVVPTDESPSTKCEACRLSGEALLPSAACTPPLKLSTKSRTLAFVAQERHHAKPLDPARLSRAPPQA